MAVPLAFPEWVRVNVSETDKQLLKQIVDFHGTGSEAGVIRKLIRDEGRRLGLLAPIPSQLETLHQLEPAQ